MNIKQTILNISIMLFRKGIQIIGRDRASLVSAYLVEGLSPILTQATPFGGINFFCPGKVPALRARALLTQEPETIEWINTFHNTDILWDIGANVGVYSLYAALRKLTVISFEPSPSNYYLLNRNIEINRMDDQISALCIAFNDVTKLDSFYMANTELGGAANSFGEAVNMRGESFTATFNQGMIGFGIDDFIEQFSPPFPNHIKIDVDGIESKIIKGAEKTLRDKRVKSVLVELDSSREEYCTRVVEMIENSGIKFHKKKNPPQLDNSKFSSEHNHFFFRGGGRKCNEI